MAAKFPLRAELTKLTSLRGTAWCLGLSVVLTIVLSGWFVSASKFFGDIPQPSDTFSFAYRSMSGDGSVVARVVSQDASHPWAKAGVILRENLSSGSRYAAVIVTPQHGVRWQAAFGTDVAGDGAAATRWLRLTRRGTTITGDQSADGVTWRTIRTVDLAGLPATVQVGLFVTSPPNIEYQQGGGASSINVIRTVGRAVFDHVAVAPPAASAGAWSYRAVAPEPVAGGPQARPGPGGMSENAGQFTVTGDGDIAWYGIPSFVRPDQRDLVSDSLGGVQIGLLAIVVLGVLAATGEYRSGMIRISLAACPSRGRLLAAKALALAGVTFVAGLLASAVAFIIAQPVLHHRGMRPPAYPYRTLLDAVVLRAVTGTAVFLALLAVFALAIGMLVRRPSRAIPLVVVLVMVPQLVGKLLALGPDLWLTRLTPAAGLAIQQTVVRFDTAIGPWTGLGVLTAYTGTAYAFALWSLKARDA